MSIFDESYDEQQLRELEENDFSNNDAGEEAHYWFTIAEFADLIDDYGMEKVLKDVNQRRLQIYGSGDCDVLVAGPGGDKGTQ